ncbi:hypothetical protein EYF80_015166 [Liparis tanakae]|uniref:Uncharacterized protein n=1 Tax=Liparis tanakae TaxID=230148 RepID=A0A4Z2I965_9TELE|nr:hypothetical protein EYF80_015166 [Liparis tanakae]
MSDVWTPLDFHDTSALTCDVVLSDAPAPPDGQQPVVVETGQPGDLGVGDGLQLVQVEAIQIRSRLLPVSTSHRDTDESACPVTTCLREALYSAQVEQRQVIFASHQQMRLGLLRKGRAQQQEGEAAVFWDATRLPARELQTDAFQTVMAGNVPNLQLLAKKFTRNH